jgi:LysR family nitrogen assimilation transcriptional regulator
MPPFHKKNMDRRYVLLFFLILEVDMDLRQLRYFLGVAEAGSISAASIKVGIAQPALSQQIARLEADLSVQLMTRGARGITLTSAGGVLRERAGVLLRDLQGTRDAVLAEAGGPVKGSVTIGLPTTVAMALTLPLLRAMRERHPQIALRLVETQSGHLLDWMLQGRMDVAILFDTSGPQARGLEVQPLVTEELQLASPWNCDLGGEGDVPLALALTLPVLLPSREHGFRRLLDAQAAQVGGTWNVVAEVDALPHLKSAVAAGLAHTVLPSVALSKEIQTGLLRVRRIGEPVLRRTAVLALRSGRPISAAVRVARELIAELVRDQIQRGEWSGAAGPPKG